MANHIVEMGGEAVEDEEGTMEAEYSAGSVTHLAVAMLYVRSSRSAQQVSWASDHVLRIGS